jgi:hypothetical protein
MEGVQLDIDLQDESGGWGVGRVVEVCFSRKRHQALFVGVVRGLGLRAAPTNSSPGRCLYLVLLQVDCAYGYCLVAPMSTAWLCPCVLVDKQTHARQTNILQCLHLHTCTRELKPTRSFV